MKTCFADTFYFLALLNEDDEAHERVAEFLENYDGRMVTTEWVLTEVGDALAGVRDRRRFVEFLRFLREDPDMRIVRAAGALFDQGVALYAARRDKEWSLTDCISFVVMRRNRLIDALTGDHHFEQAGFRALFK